MQIYRTYLIPKKTQYAYPCCIDNYARHVTTTPSYSVDKQLFLHLCGQIRVKRLVHACLEVLDYSLEIFDE